MNSEEILQHRHKLLGRNFPLFYHQPLHLVRGKGVWLWDAEGKRYLDAYNNVPVVGHCHPYVVEAMTKQAGTLNTHTRYLHENIVEYSERLLNTFDDSLSMAMLTCTGSEANELALRMARHCTGGDGIIVTDFAYHGNTTAIAEISTAFMPATGKTKRVGIIPSPDSYRPLRGLTGEALADAYADEVKKVIDQFHTLGIKPAALIICPEFAIEGLLDVPGNFIEQAVSHVREAGGLYIADEVQGGFGRTGTMWSHQRAQVVPDIVTMGKPMGNGYPLAGVAARGELATEFGQHAMYFNTFGGNPVSCAVGKAVLDVFEKEELLQNANETGPYLANGLELLKARYDIIGDVRHRGLFFGVELVTDRIRKTPATKEADRVVNLMREQGVLIGKIGPHDCVLKIRPPLPFKTDHADLLLSVLDEALTRL